MKLPVLRVFFDVLVDFVPMLDGAANERFGKDPGSGLLGSGRREFDFFPPGGRSFIFGEGGRALRVSKLVERLVHVGRWIQIVLKEKLHRAFARFTSSSHTNQR